MRSVWLEELEALFVTGTFAEAGEFETARVIVCAMR